MLTQEKLNVFAPNKGDYIHSNNNFDEVLKIAKKIDIDNTTLATILSISEASLFRYVNGGPALLLSNKSKRLTALFIDIHTYLNSISNGDLSFERQWMKMENDYLGDAPILIMRNPNGLAKILEYLKSRSPSVIYSRSYG